jgi:hypothetical protein
MLLAATVCVCVFITAVPIIRLFAWGRGLRVEDMCYERRRAEAWVDQSAHHALVNAGARRAALCSTFGLCNTFGQVFHDCVGIRKALRRCQPGVRRPSRRSSPKFPFVTPTMQAVQELFFSFHQTPTRRRLSDWFRGAGQAASRWLVVTLVIVSTV